MGGKARRRREKNYLAAHGGNRRLPPPPDSSAIDAIPSKLRKLMSLTEKSGKAIIGSAEKKKGDGGRNSKEKVHLGSEVTETKRNSDNENSLAQDPEKKKKKKRKRKQVNDLRFEAQQELVGSKRKERRKQRSEERKKKRKKNKEQENVDFHARDEVKFGDVVQAPPKLVAVPKAFKSSQDASQERLRVRAVEAYRKRKAWASRPGVQLPPVVTMSSSF